MAYKPHQLVNELLQSLGSALPPDEEERLLSKAALSPVTAPRENCLDVLQNHSPNSSAFAAKYLEVKEKNFEILGPCIELMAKIAEDPKLQKFLRKIPGQHKHSRMNGTKKQLSAASAVTTESLPLVKSQLKAANKELERSQNDQRTERSSQHESLRHNGSILQTPTFPLWFSSRPHFSRDFVTTSSPESRLLTLVNVSVVSQESALLADMVNCLAGVDGKHVAAMPLHDPYAKRTFKFAEGTDPALQEMCSKVLVLASHYSLVVRFVEQKNDFHFGRVNNALAAAIDEHLLEYLTFVVQIETQLAAGELHLQKLLFSIHPMLHVMSVLAHLAQAINNGDAQGGKVLSLLHQNAVRLVGDQEGQLVCLELTRRASAPYLASLDTWLLCGVIEDPFDEFLVEDNQVETELGPSLDDCDGYWEKRYMVRRERVPSFLGQHTDKILRTGKYLNVIRQCGKSVKSPQTERTEYTFSGRECELAIEKAYQFASKTLLEILMTEYDLKGRLRWMKHFFLLEQGDFISQFMDACEGELRKPVLEVEPSRLESLLGLVLRTSSAAAAMGGCYLEDLHTQLLTISLPAQMHRILTISADNYNASSSRVLSGGDIDESQLTGMEGFTFRVDVKWPVSLVLSSHDLSRYQMVFRHLFFIKHVERLLCRVWSSNKVARAFDVGDSPLYRPAFALRQRMLSCVQSLEYYMTSEVIEPNWCLFMERINKVSSVDEVLLCHSDFIDQCQRECMLTVSELLLPLRHLLDACIAFCSFILHVRKYFVEAELGSELTESVEPVELLIKSVQGAELRGSVAAEGWESFESQVCRHEQRFSTLLHELLELVSRLGRDSANAKLLNVLYTLDFNGFYSGQLGQPQRASSAHGHTSG